MQLLFIYTYMHLLCAQIYYARDLSVAVTRSLQEHKTRFSIVEIHCSR